MVSDHFGLDVRRTGGEITPGDYHIINLVADIDAGDQIVEETESVKLVRDGNGALLRWIKNASGAPEHVDFAVKDRRAGRNTSARICSTSGPTNGASTSAATGMCGRNAPGTIAS